MKFVFIVLLCAVSRVHGHLRLTYPQARQYALDFLDNVRTTPPCGGMEYKAGGHITTIVTGMELMATWHLAYPHMGGIRFELINVTSGAVTANLTGDGYQYTNDSTVLSHNLTFGEEHECDHCILRITRQAGEWTAGADGYLFWSCADVKIISPGDACYSGKCMNGGTCDAGTCTCPKTYQGERCQYKNDCEDDGDCNSNGVCFDIEASSYPKKVCYCNAGKMGRYCSKDSPVSNAVKTDAELSDYYRSEMFANPSYNMYWKLLGDNKDEIEFVLRVETNTWVALGWRPNTVTGTCRDFPTKVETPTGEPEPEATPGPETTPAATPEATTAGEVTTAPVARKRREVEYEVQGHVVSRVRRQTEPNVIKDLCLAGNVSEAVALATANFNSVPGAEPEPVPEGTPAPGPEGTAAPGQDGTAAPQPEGTTPNLHPMDCQDVVVISAEGNRHRVLDSYTRDRATPRPDSFYGGQDDLTAATAAIVDGVLHAVFRRKLMSTDPADHTLTDGNTLFIWARGQDPVRFYHWPLTGLERCLASNYDFYKINQLQYHGTKNTQRGSRSINVFEDPNSSETASEGSHSSPSGCTGDACDYTAQWKYRKSLGVVQFTISAKVALQKWAAIGFSKDQLMVNSDAIVVWMDDATSAPTVTDRFLSAQSAAGVALDSTQNTAVTGGSYDNGMMTVEFTRPLDTEDRNDYSLASCRYFLYAWGGDVNGNDLTYHTQRETSTAKICIDSGSIRIFLSSVLSWSWIICTVLISRLTL